MTNKLCECGCGKPVTKESNRFIIGHNSKGENHPFYGKVGKNASFYGKIHLPSAKKRLRNCNVGKNNPMFGKIATNNGISHTLETKLKISKKLKGRKHSVLTIKKLKNSFSGRKHTTETLEKMKIAKLGKKLSEETKNKIRKTRVERNLSSIGKNETKILDEYERYLGYKIQRQEPINNGQYFVDGYVPQLNVAIEVDETHHFKNGQLRTEDIIRQKNIEEVLGCEFVRIKDTR